MKILITLTCEKCGAEVRADRMEFGVTASECDICGTESVTTMEATGTCACGAHVDSEMVVQDSTHSRTGDDVSYVALAVGGTPTPVS